MTSREQMLDRIRMALGRPPAEPMTATVEARPLPPARLEGVMPPISSDQLVAKFESEVEKLSGSVCRAANTRELETVLRQTLGAAHARRVVVSRNPLLSELGLADKLTSWGMAVSQWTAESRAGAAEAGQQVTSFREASFEAEVGLTGVEFVLAETGSLILTSRTEGAQLASLAPPVHVALYRESQVLASLDDVLERLKEAGGPLSPDPGRSVVFVTGSSRTADIEQVLIRGVHGPREVHAILIGEPCLT